MATFNVHHPLVVGDFGHYIDNDVMDAVMSPNVIGASPWIHVATTSEATALVYLNHVNSSHVTFVAMNPRTRSLVLPVCVGESSDGVWSGHYVVLHVNLMSRIAILHDSIAGTQSFDEITKKLANITNNIWGSHVLPCRLVLGSSDHQVALSNDCGVFCFRNVCAIVSCAHVMPFLGGVDFVGSFDFICRDVFRSIVASLP